MTVATIVIPVKDEEESLRTLLERLEQTASRRSDIEFRFLFVDDGSADGSARLLDEMAAASSRVQVIHFSRNFGHQMAVTAGLDRAQGEFVGLIDADLQDPPELLVDMIEVLEEGHDVVYGQRRHREGETHFKIVTAKLFYRILSAVTQVEIPSDTGDFRVMRREVVTALGQMRERHRFIRGMVAWVGFRSRAFPYDRAPRRAGKTKYNVRRMLGFASNAIFSFSRVPLQLASWIGGLVAAFGGLGMGYIIALDIFYGDYIPGVSSTLFAVLFMGGVQLISIGIIGEYVGRLLEESKGRPLYVVARTANLDLTESKEKS